MLATGLVLKGGDMMKELGVRYLHIPGDTARIALALE
jgi:hypothetical protein